MLQHAAELFGKNSSLNQHDEVSHRAFKSFPFIEASHSRFNKLSEFFLHDQKHKSFIEVYALNRAKPEQNLMSLC